MDLQQDETDTADGRLLKDLKVFHDVARALTSTLDRDTLLRAIMNQMAQFFAPESWSMLLVDEDGRDLYFAVLDGQFDPAASVQTALAHKTRSPGLRIPMGEGMAGWVAAHGEPLIVPDVQGLNASNLDGIRFSEAERMAISVPVHSAISLPLEFSIIFVDLDHFKNVNDNYGHLLGTELLIEVARLMQLNTRAVDMVFRYGGDEFVVLLPQTGKSAAVDAAERLRHALKEARFLSSHALKIAMVASFGVATYPQDGRTAEAILQAADGLMYKVKHSTRDGIAS
jgi:diguanylate cyclase (GGDEF)-like protein